MSVFTVSKVANDNYALAWPGNKLTVLTKTVDFSVAANALAGSGGVMGIFKIPAKVKVIQFGMRVITADTDVTTVDLGIYTEDPTTLAITEVDLDGLGVSMTIASTGYVAMDVDAAMNPQGSAAGYIVAADSVLSIYNADTDAINGAKIEFFAILVDVSGYSSITPGGTGSYTT